MSVMQPSLPRYFLTVTGFFVFALIQFRVGWGDGVTVHSQDFNIGVISIYDRLFPADWWEGSWTSSGLLGAMGTRFLNLTNLLIVLLPVEAATDLLYPILLTVAASGMFVFATRSLRLGWPAGLLAGLAVAWFGTNVTLVNPGHLYKFGVLAFACWFPVVWMEAVRRRSWAWAVSAGVVFAMMFYEQQDMAVLFGVLLGPWALFESVRGFGANKAA